MPALQTWVEGILRQPLPVIKRRYNRSWRAEEEISSIIRLSGGEYRFVRKEHGQVDALLLSSLHRKIRLARCEAKIWQPLFLNLTHPLPVHIAHDLIARDIAVTGLGHTRQVDEVQWRLCFLVDEALLTWVYEILTDSDDDTTQLEKLLEQFPLHPWLIQKWEHWNIASHEKAIVFHRWVWNHPNRPANVPSPKEFLLRLRGQELDELREEQRLVCEAEEIRLKFRRIATQKMHDAELNAIFEERDPAHY